MWSGIDGDIGGRYETLKMPCSIFVQFVIATFVVLDSPALPSDWPMVEPLRQTRTLVNPGKDNDDTPFVALIKNTAGVPIYKFECHNGNYENGRGTNFSGDFQCALFAVDGATVTGGNLLAANTRDEQSTDWWNRGRCVRRSFEESA